MLTKPPFVTIVPAVAGRAYAPATHECSTVPPVGVGGGDGTGWTPPPGAGATPEAYVPPAGTPIILEVPNGDGSFDTYTGLAPAPEGFVCRIETEIVTVVGSTEPATIYNVVCTGPAP